MQAGLERACLRSVLEARCVTAAASDFDYLRRLEALPADHLLGVQILLQSECEAALEAADELEQMLAGGQA